MTAIGPGYIELIGLGFLIATCLARRSSEATKEPGEFRAPHGRWVDIASPYDPVCIGSSITGTPAQTLSVVNQRHLWKLLKEHMSYFENPAVGAALARSAERGLLANVSFADPYRTFGMLRMAGVVAAFASACLAVIAERALTPWT